MKVLEPAARGSPQRTVGIVSSWPRDIRRGSGTARYLQDLARSLADSGCKVVSIGADLDPSDYRRFVEQRAQWNRRLCEDARIREVDVLLAIDFDGYALAVGDACAPKIVCPQGVFAELSRTEPEPYRSILRRQAVLERANIRGAVAVIVPSAAAGAAVVCRYRLDPGLVRSIPHGFDLSAWRERIRSAAEEFGRPLTILTVARLYPRKNVETLIRSMPALRGRFPGIRLRIVGDGIDGERLRRIAAGSPETSGVVFEGEIDDPGRMAFFYRNADLFCLPSRFESFGFVFLEAMGAGLAVVSGNSGGAEEIVGPAGVRIDPLDPRGLARALEDLLARPEEREAMGRIGMERATEFTWERAAGRYIAVIEEVLAEAGRGSARSLLD